MRKKRKRKQKRQGLAIGDRVRWEFDKRGTVTGFKRPPVVVVKEDYNGRIHQIYRRHLRTLRAENKYFD